MPTNERDPITKAIYEDELFQHLASIEKTFLDLAMMAGELRAKRALEIAESTLKSEPGPT